VSSPFTHTPSARSPLAVECLLDALVDEAYLVDGEGRIVAHNRRGRPTPDEEPIVGARLSERFASADEEPWLREKLSALIDEVEASGEGVRWETQLAPTGANERSIEFSIACFGPRCAATLPDTSPSADARRYLVVLRDFTLRDAEEVRCRQALAELENMQLLMELQSNELHTANLELEAARARTEAAAQAKSDFLANMSHEIRTPMTAILGYADMLLGEEGLERAPLHRRVAIETIQRNGAHLLAVINDILDLSKIEAGKMTCESIECSIFEIVDDVVGLLEFRAKGKGLVLRSDFVGRLPARIHSDPTRLRQILLNLVGNAIKFTECGSVTLRVSAACDGESTIVFEVIDTGIGLTPAQLSLLFRPFVQTDTSTTRRFGGTGLGLSICKRLAEMLGGDVGVISEPGRGSTFRVTINPGDLWGVRRISGEEARRRAQMAAASKAIEVRPPQPEQASSTAASAEPGSPAAAPAEPLRNRRILLAEDGPDNQRLISFLLRKAGAEVIIVDNGRAAVDAALEAARGGNPFDVVVTDMQMPIMDGYEATRALRSEGYRGPVVALTASAMTGDREKCLAAGCDDYAVKPIDKTRLIATVTAAVERATAISP
jgi:signal transduction histidine kinase